MFDAIKYKLGMTLTVALAMVSAASAAVNLSALWDFITEITDNQDVIIGVIILVVVLAIVRKFGKSLGDMLNISGK